MMSFQLTGQVTFLSDGAIGILFLLIVIGLNALGSYEMANAVFYLVMNLATIRISAYLGRSEDTQLSYFFLFALIFVVFDHPFTRLFCIAVILARTILFELNYRHLSGIAALLPENHQAVIHWTTDICILSLTLVIFYLSVNWKIREDRLNEKKGLFVEEMIHDMRSAFLAHGGICATLKYATDENIPLSDSKALIGKLMETKSFFSYVLNELLDYSIFEKGMFDQMRYEEMDVSDEITKVVSAYNFQALRNGITIHLQIARNMPAVIQSDRVKVIRIFINLLSNAIKFTDHGKSITVTVDADDNQWSLAIINQGKPLTQEEMAGLFLLKSKHREGRDRGRNGLGLPITKELVNRLGGTIQVSSGSSIQGTAVTVSVPFS